MAIAPAISGDSFQAAVAAPLPPARSGDNVLDGDLALLEGLRREGGADREDGVREFGEIVGRLDWIERGFAANERTPEHVSYDRAGARVDSISFDPSWHELLGLAVENGVAGAPWADPRPGAHVARAARFLLVAQIEAGITCPLAMTYSCVPALRLEPGLAADWEPLVSSGVYDPRELPASQKNGALIGMALTERSGGSDVAGSGTVAVPAPGGDEGEVLVSGGKWFVSAVQSDAFFALAQTDQGMSLALVPRLDEDGRPNGFHLDRLKPKLGNRSNPTAEVVLTNARGRLVGEPGHGVRAIMAMIGGTRHDCVLGSTAVMRLGTAEAIHWAIHRQAFGAALIDQPAMKAVLADLALESEAATAGAMRLARANETAHAGDGDAEMFRRLAAPVLKYWTCKRAPQHLAEALECQGGFGYIEESRLARAYREAPLMSVWEGSGNVQALDVLRAWRRSPASLDALLSEIELAAGANARLDAAISGIRSELAGDPVGEAAARGLCGRLARTLQASLLVRHSTAAVSDAFCAARLGEGAGGAFGDLPAGADLDAILERARPDR
ncbi:MAG: putative acyl-CoA dehydrogenase [Thermoleophilaceae bacterium]|jgi:putative acyl-CoA dehydrogenase|nr:putative acyl-CoA dehydrogenase [Thermoleophilaceae bacterium]